MIKKIITFSLLFIIISLNAPVYAINVGTYQTETEYGLLDGFKINWKRKDKSQPFIEAREESTKQERDKERADIKKDEYQYTKYMYEGKSVI